MPSSRASPSAASVAGAVSARRQERATERATQRIVAELNEAGYVRDARELLASLTRKATSQGLDRIVQEAEKLAGVIGGNPVPGSDRRSDPVKAT